MLQLLDDKSSIYQQWPDLKASYNIFFHTSCLDLVHYHSDDSAITVFYGFLDQDTAELNAVEYIQAIIKRKGMAGLNQCYGSFIVIYYDYSSHKFLLANDAMGDFALHYTKVKNTLHVSDLPQALLNYTDTSVNQDRLLHYFALTQPQDNGSFFKNIKQLKPGQYLTLIDKEINIDKYYQPANTVNYQWLNEDELSEQFNALIQKVIRYQTQGESHVGVMMSGGMDSTFVATHCLNTNKRVSTFSYVFPNMPEANESLWIDSMRSMNLSMNTFVGEPYWPLKSPWPLSINSPIGNPYRGLKSAIYQQAHNHNIKIVLSGVFADHLYTGYIYHLVDQLKHKPFTALKSLYSISRSLGLKTGLKQVAPAKWRRKIKPSAPWLTKHAQQQLRAIEFQSIKHPHPQQYALAYGIATAQSSYLDNEYGFKHQLTVRHPFRDRRIVEFLMSIPAWILGDINNPKRFVRNTALNILPDSILRRKKITSLKPLFIKGILNKELDRVKSLINRADSSWHRYVKKEIIQTMLKQPNGSYRDADYMILWQCISYELWISSEKIRLN